MDRIRPTDTTEEKIENLTDPEASAIFREAFYAEAKALEKEALAHPVEVDEEQKEALRRRILESVGAEMENTEALEKEAEGVPEKTEVADTPVPKDVSSVEMPERRYSMEASEEIATEGMSEKKSATGTSKRVYSMGTMEAADSEEDSEKIYPADTKRKKRRFSPLVRWVAVLVLACVGVLGVSMTSQAKGSGLWSSIQRLIGVETRWEQENNGEDRNISNPKEYKAIQEIEDTLGMKVPEFFYWPGEVKFAECEIDSESYRFMMIYTSGDNTFYFEGWNGDADVSANDVWRGEGNIWSAEYNGVYYTISEIESDVSGTFYYVEWMVNSYKFLLSGVTERNEIENILKNIKN